MMAFFLIDYSHRAGLFGQFYCANDPGKRALRERISDGHIDCSSMHHQERFESGEEGLGPLKKLSC